jgi:mycofactocin system glycosyltransferase
VLDRFEAARSALDMGRLPELVRHGARLGFVPSAALLVRRSALGSGGFDEQLRLGEDVDLVWRLGEAGWHVRFDPGVTVRHRSRERWRDWIVRSYEYGTSAALLDERHPGHLVPARLSGWNLAALVLIACRQPVPAVAATSLSGLLLSRALPDLPSRRLIAGETVVRGLLADGAQIGRLIRREWWPVGVAALALSPRSRAARVAAACMLVPVAMDYTRERPRLDPLRYTLLQLADDAAYGTGVLASSVRARTLRPLIPHVRVPPVKDLLVRRSRGRSGP